MTFTHALSTNNYGPAKFIVDASAANGTHTTIAAALTSASSGDTIFIRPGTYTENLTLKVGVNLTAFESDSSINGTGKVIISGTCTLTAAGSVTISGIQLQTNSAALLAVTGSAASVVNLNNCYLNCTNTTGITFSAASTSSQVNLFRCQGDIGTTGIGLFSHSSTGTLNIFYSKFTNSGGSSTASTISAGALNFKYSECFNPITASSTGALAIDYSLVDSSAQNATAVTSVGGTFLASTFSSGSASAISASSGTTIVADITINSTNTNGITGAGTLALCSSTCIGTDSAINTTTVNLFKFFGGQYVGRGTSTAPSATTLGEYISATGSAVALTATTAANIASISLTPGIWDVTCLGFAAYTAGTSTALDIGISATSATITGTQGDQWMQVNFTGSAQPGFSIPAFRVSLAATTTYYLVMTAFGTGTIAGTGRISATRVA